MRAGVHALVLSQPQDAERGQQIAGEPGAGWSAADVGHDRVPIAVTGGGLSSLPQQPPQDSRGRWRDHPATVRPASCPGWAGVIADRRHTKSNGKHGHPVHPFIAAYAS